MKITAATSVCNEGPFLIEWLAWHRLIGVTDFLIFSNDCTDGTDVILDALAGHGIVQHIRQDRDPDKSVQWQGLRKAWKQPVVQQADWLLLSDLDEFPVIHVGEHRLRDAIAAMAPDVQAISLPWRLLGANGRVDFRDDPVVTQFTRSAPPDLHHPIAGRFFKSLFRPQAFEKPGIHRPKRPRDGAETVWCDGAGQRLPEGFVGRDGQIVLPGQAVGRDVIELHHYSLRSVQSFLVKMVRGLPSSQRKLIDLNYWVERNFNTVENRAALRLETALRGEMERLMALEGVAALHYDACQRHGQAFEQVVRSPHGYRLFCDCIHAGASYAPDPALAARLYAMFQNVPQGE